jgi:hypothetical protein
MTSIAVNTIQELIDHRYSVTIYCHNPRCHHRADLDLVKLRTRLGPDHGMLFDDIKHKLVCGKCGGKRFGMTNQPRTMDKGSGWMTRR